MHTQNWFVQKQIHTSYIKKGKIEFHAWQNKLTKKLCMHFLFVYSNITLLNHFFCSCINLCFCFTIVQKQQSPLHFSKSLQKLNLFVIKWLSVSLNKNLYRVLLLTHWYLNKQNVYATNLYVNINCGWASYGPRAGSCPQSSNDQPSMVFFFNYNGILTRKRSDRPAKGQLYKIFIKCIQKQNCKNFISKTCLKITF